MFEVAEVGGAFGQDVVLVVVGSVDGVGEGLSEDVAGLDAAHVAGVAGEGGA